MLVPSLFLSRVQIASRIMSPILDFFVTVLPLSTDRGSNSGLLTVLITFGFFKIFLAITAFTAELPMEETCNTWLERNYYHFSLLRKKRLIHEPFFCLLLRLSYPLLTYSVEEHILHQNRRSHPGLGLESPPPSSVTLQTWLGNASPPPPLQLSLIHI